jgi:hypothetical protein
MARFQEISRAKICGQIGPVTLAADNTPVAIDVRGYTNVQVVVQVGIGGITFDATNKIEIKLRDGDGTVGNHAAVEAADVKIYAATDMGTAIALGSGGIVRSLVAAHAAATTYIVDYVGDQGYVSVLADFSGTHGTGTPICITVVGQRGPLNPPV